MSFKQDYEEARKKALEKKEEELQLRAEKKEETLAEAVLNKARAEKLRKEHKANADIQSQIDAFQKSREKTFADDYNDSMQQKNTELFKEYVESSRADHLDDAVRTGILEGTLPFEDVAKVYKESIGDWNPQIKDPKKFDLYDITRDFGYNKDTNELEWYVNSVGNMDAEDFRQTISFEQLHSEVGQSNISEYTHLWQEDYKTPDSVRIEMPDGTIEEISNDAFLKPLPSGKITEMNAVIESKRGPGGELVNPVEGRFTVDDAYGIPKSIEKTNKWTQNGWEAVNHEKMIAAGLITDDSAYSGQYLTSLEKVYSPESIADGSAIKDYEKTLREFGGYDEDEIAKKLQAFNLHSMYDYGTTLSNKYGWLPGAVNAFKYGINLNNKIGWDSDDEGDMAGDDRFTLGSGTTVIQIPGTDRYLPIDSPKVPYDKDSIIDVEMYNQNLESSYPKIDNSTPEKFLETHQALNKKLEAGFFERTINGLDALMLGDFKNRKEILKRDKSADQRFNKFQSDFNYSLIAELNNQIGDGLLTTSEARRVYERANPNIPSASIRFNEGFDDYRGSESGVVSGIYETLGKWDSGYHWREKNFAGKFIHSFFSSDTDGMSKDEKWAFFTEDNQLTGEHGGSQNQSEFFQDVFGVLVNAYMLKPAGMVMAGTFQKAFTTVKPALSPGGGAGVLASRPFVVKSAEYLVKAKDHAASLLSRMTGGRINYTLAQKLGAGATSAAIHKANKDAIATLAAKLGTKTLPQITNSMHNLGTFFGVHQLVDDMSQHGVYNIKLREALNQYGSGAFVGAFLPGLGAFGNRLTGGTIRQLGKWTGIQPSNTMNKIAGLVETIGGVGVEAGGFSLHESTTAQLFQHGISEGWDKMRMPTLEEYGHSLAFLGALKVGGGISKGFKAIEDYAFKTERYKIEFTGAERKLIRDYLKVLHPEKQQYLKASDKVLRDALIKANKGDVQKWTELLKDGMPVNLVDKILFSWGVRPKKLMKVFNVKVREKDATTEIKTDKDGNVTYDTETRSTKEPKKGEVLLLGPANEVIEVIETPSIVKAKEVRDRTRQLINGGEQLELPLNTTIDELGNYDLLGEPTPTGPIVTKGGAVVQPKQQKVSTSPVKPVVFNPKELVQKHDINTSEGLKSLVRELPSDKVKDMGKDLPYKAVSSLVKELGLKPKSRSKIDMVSALKENLGEVPSIDKLRKRVSEKPQTLSSRIAESGLERKYGKDWKDSNKLKADLSYKYGVDSIDKLNKQQLRHFEADVTAEDIDRTFEDGPQTIDGPRNVSDIVMGVGKYTYNDLPKHIKNIGEKIGVNAKNFKERFESWTGETKTKAGKFFKRVWDQVKNYWNKSKEFIKEYLKNPKIGATIEVVGKDGKPLKEPLKTKGVSTEKELQVVVDKLSSKNIRKAKEPVPQFTNISDLSKHLTQRALKIQEELGINLRENTPESNDMVARIISSEIEAENKREWNADGWYSEKIQDALKVAEGLYPEMKDPIKRTAFTAGLAITSNGQGVPSNSLIATQQFEYYLKNGEWNENFGKNLSKSQKKAMGAGKEMPAMRKSFKLYNTLAKNWGEDVLHKFLNTDFTVRELRDAGIKDISEELLGTTVKGSSIFGPKIGGAFFQNLQGNGEPLTMDMHFVRNMRRITGDLLPEAGKGKEFGRDYSNQLRKFKNAIRSNKSAREKYGITREVLGDDAAMIDIAQEIHKAYERGGFKKKTILNRRAKNLDEHINLPKEAPGGGGERNRFRDIMKRVVEMTNEKSVADAQAKIWFPQKRLYGKFGIKGESINETDYRQEFVKLAKERGLNDKRIKELLGTEQSRVAGEGGIEVAQVKENQGLSKSQRKAILEKGKEPLEPTLEKSPMDKRGSKDPALDFGGLEVGMNGFTPQNMKILRKGLIDTGHFLYESLPKYVAKAGEKVGITAKNFREQYKKFESNPDSFSQKAKGWFKRVWAHMKNWWNKNKHIVYESNTFRNVKSAFDKHVLHRKYFVSADGDPVKFSQKMENLEAKIDAKGGSAARRDHNRRALARIKLTERSLLGEEIKVGPKKYVKDMPILAKKDLYDLQNALFKQIPINPTEAKQISNLKELFQKAQNGNPLAEIGLEMYQEVLASYQNRQRAFNLLDNKTIAKKIKQGLDYRRTEKTLKERRIEKISNVSKRKNRDHTQVDLKDPELAAISDSNLKRKPKQMRRAGMEKPTRKEKLARFRYQLNRTEGAFDKYEQMTGLPIYQNWIDYRDAKGRRDLYKEKLMEPMTKVLKELGYNSVRDIDPIVGMKIQNYRNGIDVELTPQEIKLNDALTEIYENPEYQKDIAINRYERYRQTNEDHIPGVKEADLEMLNEFIEYKEYDNFFEAIGKVEGFIKENYTPQYLDILTQDVNSQANTGLSKGGLNPQSKETLDMIKNDPAKYSNALTNLDRKVNSDANITFLDDIVTDIMKIANHKTIPQAMSQDIKHVMESDLNVASQDMFSSGVGKFTGRLMAAVLSTPVKWGRNSLQRFMAIPHASLKDMPSAFGNIFIESFGKGALNVRKSSTFLNADPEVREFFMSNTSSQSALNEDYLRIGQSGWLDKLPWVKNSLDRFKGIYGLVDLSSRWTDFNDSYSRSLPLLEQYKNGEVKFSEIRKRIGWDAIDVSMQNRLLPEIQSGNMKYVAMQIADYITASKSQFRYQKMERSLLEHSTMGRMWMYAQNYPMRFLGQFGQDFQTLYHGLPINRNAGGKHSWDTNSGDWHKFNAGMKGVVGRTILSLAFEELLNRVFGYRDKYGWGYRLRNMAVGLGGLLGQAISLTGDFAQVTQEIISTTYDSITGEIDEREKEKRIKKVLREGVDLLEHMTKKQVVGVEYGLNIIEGLIGKDHKELKPLRMLITEFGWDNYEALDVEEKRTWWQLVQKTLGGTAHTPEQARRWQELREKPGRRKRRKKKTTPPTNPYQHRQF